jgi:hypothetical protein
MTEIINLNKYPTSRLEAHEKNIPHYFTGKPCLNGHLNKRRTSDGKCLSCDSEYQKRKRKNRPEDVSRMRRAYYKKNRQRILEQHKRSHSKPECKSVRRNTELKKRYGITSDDYLLMLESQNNVCAICRGPQTNTRTNYFDVDHCHKTGKVRGLLCTNCNHGIGKFQDDKKLMLHAYNYLEDSENDEQKL